MKIKMLVSVALLAALPAAAQITHYASCNSTYTGGQNETSWSCSLNVPASGLVTVAFACNCASAPTMTVTDAKGDTFALAGDIPSPPSSDFLALHSACGAPSATSETVTMTLGAAANYGSIEVNSWSGVAASACYVANSYGWSSAGSGGNIAYSASAGQLVYAATDLSGTTAGTGFTLLNAPANELTDEFLVAASATSGNANFASVQTDEAAVFAPAAASPHAVMKGVVLKNGVVR